MPNNNPRTPKRNWRGQGPASPRTPQGGGARAWKAERAGPGGPWLTRGVKLAIALGTFLLLAVGVVVVILWMRPPDPFRLVLVGANYDQDLAVESNVLGRRALDGLDQWARDYNGGAHGDKSKNVEVRRQAVESGKDPVGEQLAGCTSKTVVVFLTAAGGGDEQGAYVLPENAGPRNLDDAYRIEKILDALKKLPHDARKLLILDASYNAADWPMRQLHNDFARSVKKLDARIKEVPNLIVLCACDEGQRSWESEEYGQTIFAHFVTEGLKGAADQTQDDDHPDHTGEGKGRVTALELVHYVQAEVERWTRRNRGFDQKPLILGDEDAAAGMELAIADLNYKEPDPSALTAWSPPDDLKKAWQEHEELANSSPPPAAYTPQQWRVYEAALLRYERLLRTDEGGSAASAVRQKAAKLHDQIVQAQRLDRDAAALTLATPAAFGWTLADEKAGQLKDGFDALWRDKTAKPDQFARLLGGAEEGADKPTRRLLRLRLVGLLLDRAAASHDDYLRASAILPKLADPPDPAPAEANFAAMVASAEAQLPAKQVASWDNLKQALAVRRSAESAALGLGAGPPELAAYSEQTAAWIGPAVTTADVKRRVGEDLLFASAREAEASAGALKAAESDKDGYKTVRDRSLVIRQAIQARDQALAELPWYTQWLGRRPMEKADEDSLEALWGGVHDLADRLEKPDFAAAPSLAETTDAVNAGLQGLRTRFRDACGPAGRQLPVLQHSLQDLEDLLTVPLIEPGLRTALLRDARRISLELNKGTAKAAAAGDDQLQDSAALAKKLAFQQARLAAAELGKDGEDAKDVLRLLPPFQQQLWQGDLDTTGDRVGRAFQNLARGAAEGADKGRRAPLAEAAAPLRQAALATRYLDAGEADAWLGSVDPVDENRRVQLHDLLVWQAGRARLDYWASADPAHPYYRAAGLVYLGDARDLAAGAPDLKDEEKAARLGAVTAAEDLLKASDRVAFRWLDGREWQAESSPLHVTDEHDMQLQYGVAGPKNAPPGRPVVWAVPGPRLLAPQDAGAPRSLERLTADPADASTPYAVSPQRPPEGPPPDDPLKVPPAREDTDFAVHGLFRGRALALDTPVILHNRPDLVSYQPKEQKTALIAVQADPADLRQFAARNGELVVVMDYSLSMDKPADPKAGKGSPRRIDRALDALEQCLDKLPDGVNLAVMTFSAKGQTPIAVHREKSPWSKTQARDLMDSLRALRPAYDTPLVRVTAEAAKLFTPNFKGTKTILILTDGGDNEFNPRKDGQDGGKDLRVDARTGKELKMAEYLHQKFDGKGVRIHVVGFKEKELQLDPDANEDEIRGLKEFEPAIKDIGGTFQDVEDADQLAKELAQYFLQVRFRVEYDNGDPIDAAAREGLQVTATNKNVRPTIPVPAPADYHVLIEAFRNEERAGHNLPDQHVHVEPGEVLILDLKQSSEPDRPFDLRRDVFARSNLLKLSRPVMDPLPAGKDWLMTVLGNAPAPNRVTRDARDLTVSVERGDDHVAVQGTVRQGRPVLAWFNVLPDGGKAPASGLRFYPLANYPAPVWRLSLADWRPQPAGAAPVVDAWWCEDEIPESAVVTLHQGPGREYTLPADLNGRAVDVRPTPGDPAGQVVVEGVGLEKRYVEEQPGRWTPDVDCLVVRLRYPPGRPYFVQLPDELMKTGGGQQAGHEHRFYAEANKYTGVFYDVGPSQLQNLAWLKLVSVEGAKTRAVHPDPVAVRQDGQPPDPFK